MWLLLFSFQKQAFARDYPVILSRLGLTEVKPFQWRIRKMAQNPEQRKAAPQNGAAFF
jgi:hypothetical protein